MVTQSIKTLKMVHIFKKKKKRMYLVKQKQTHRNGKQTSGYEWERGVRRDKLVVWDSVQCSRSVMSNPL